MSKRLNQYRYIFLALFTVIAFIFIYDNIPTREMRELRSYEKKLLLPKEKGRLENDEDCHKDGKGAVQCNRSIWLEYDDMVIFDEIGRKAKLDGWEVMIASTDNMYFVDYKLRKCIHAVKRHNPDYVSIVLYGDEPKSHCAYELDN